MQSIAMEFPLSLSLKRKAFAFNWQITQRKMTKEITKLHKEKEKNKIRTLCLLLPSMITELLYWAQLCLRQDLFYNVIMLIFLWLAQLYKISMVGGQIRVLQFHFIHYVKLKLYCGVPGSPSLSKTGLILARIFQFLVVCQYVSTNLRTKGLTAHVSSWPRAKVVLRRPRLAGTSYSLIRSCLSGCDSELCGS